uniref:Uncharacterized protein n=1 Tax=Salix viminalis TaxID=40686 RepID=A0A6N2MUD9_SALVM
MFEGMGFAATCSLAGSRTWMDYRAEAQMRRNVLQLEMMLGVCAQPYANRHILAMQQMNGKDSRKNSVARIGAIPICETIMAATKTHSNFTFPFSSLTTLCETCLDSSSTSLIFLPINLFTEKKVFSGFTTACLFAICPTSRSPFAVYAPTNGVVLCPSAFVTILGFPPSIAATAELVVPGSIPKMALETAGP